MKTLTTFTADSEDASLKLLAANFDLVIRMLDECTNPQGCLFHKGEAKGIIKAMTILGHRNNKWFEASDYADSILGSL